MSNNTHSFCNLLKSRINFSGFNMYNIFREIFEKVIVRIIMVIFTPIYNLFLKNIPWTANKLDGRWIGRVEINGIPRQVIWYLFEVSDCVYATAIPQSGPNKNEVFYGIGTFRNSILNMSYEKRNDIDCGTISLRFYQGTLRGSISYLDQDTGTYRSASYFLEKEVQYFGPNLNWNF